MLATKKSNAAGTLDRVTHLSTSDQRTTLTAQFDLQSFNRIHGSKSGYLITTGVVERNAGERRTPKYLDEERRFSK